ncbi:MAG: transcriptional regulator [Chitinophagales bacterium]
MKPIIENLNKSFENRVRLGMMSVLMVNEVIDYLELKELLQVTDGNLASHAAALEKAGYIKVNKDFVGKKTRTSYTATRLGVKAFQNHLKALEELIKKNAG